MDHVARLAELGPLIAQATTTSAATTPTSFPRELLELEGAELGVSVTMTCPHCSGALTEAELQGFSYYRCHVGHAFSQRLISREQEEQVERSLWAGMRALEESAFLAERLAQKATGDLKRRYVERAAERREQTRVLRDLLVKSSPQPRSARAE